MSEFILPPNQLYLCGHSLGPTTRTGEQKIIEATQAWKHYGVGAWNMSEWIDMPMRIASAIAKLIGAQAHEVAVCDSTVLNLFKVLCCALRMQAGRSIILSSHEDFPADRYIAQGIPGARLKTVAIEELMHHLNDQVAVLMLSHVQYRDASIMDMNVLTAKAHEVGALVVWDLCHSVGIIPINLAQAQADFAVGCTYKYLSGGPGSPAFIYAHAKHHEQLHSPIYGWMGHEQPFAFAAEYRSSGVNQFLGGTPPILSMSGLEGSLSLFASALCEQSRKNQANYLKKALAALGLNVITPTHSGGHVALVHEQGYALSRALIDAGVICDYRAPNLIRMCVNPFYLSMQDMTQCIGILTQILEQRVYLKPKYQQTIKVT